MILEFKKHNYVDVDGIKALRWLDEVGGGIIVLDGAKIGVDRECFDIIEAAYKYKYKTCMYNDKLKRVGGK